jgi:hypothetical protein
MCDKKDKAPRILDFETELWIAVSFTPGPLYPKFIGTWYTLERKQGDHRAGLDGVKIKTS